MRLEWVEVDYRPTKRQIVTVVLVAAFALIPPLVGRVAPDLLPGSRAGTLTLAAAFAAMAISLNLLMGYCGQISLGHSALLAIGAYTMGLITARYYLPSILGFVLAIVLGAAVAFIIGLPALRLRGLYLAVVTIGFAVMMENSILQIPWLSRGSAGLKVERPYFGNFGLTENADYLALGLVAVLFVWLLDHNVVRSKLGRAFQGIKENEQVAQSFGVDVARYKLLAFTLSGGLAGFAGALFAQQVGFIDSRTLTFDEEGLLLVVLVVLGGLGNRLGVVVAAAAFTILPDFLEFFDDWKLVIGAGLLVYTIARHPDGLASAFREAREAREAREVRRGGPVDDDIETEVPPLPDMPRPEGLDEHPPLPEGTPMLAVDDVTVHFGGLVAVDQGALAVPEGKIVGLIGPNGAGKSTLFNVVSGFIRPDTGRVTFRGEPIDHLQPHRRTGLGIGRTFQHVGLVHGMTVEENLLLAQHLLARYGPVSALTYTLDAGEIEEQLRGRAVEAIDALGLSSHLDVPVKNLSGGQKRIVEMAAALITAPDLLMLDEPSAGMAPAMVESLADRLRDLRDELGRTVLLIEHNVPLVLDVCDEIYVMSSGAVIAHGTPDEVTALPEVVEAYLGDTTVPAASARKAADGAKTSRSPRKRATTGKSAS